MRTKLRCMWIVLWMIGIGMAGGARFAAGATRGVPVSIDDLELQVARQVPAFGGMFLDSNQTLNIYLTDTRQAAVAKTAIASVFGSGRFDMTHARVLLAHYSFANLKGWHDLHRVTTLAIRGVVMTEIHKATNRLLVGVENERVTSSVQTVLANAGIPAAAVEIVVTKPYDLFDSLLDNHRPLLGGLAINDASCTMGFLAVVQGKAGFVTCSHCTNVQGGVEGTIFHQTQSLGNVNRVGIETIDPNYLASPGCPGGRVCRFSDSAFIARNGGPDPATPRPQASFGHLALADSATLTILGDLEIVARQETPVDGELVAKVGKTSGITSGVITGTCTDLNQNSTNKTLFCQDVVTESSPPLAGPGDSGSAVFSETGTPLSDLPSATLYGTLWGGNSTTFAFSPLPAIELELGTLRAFNTDPGQNSPPEVKITQPLAFSHVGVGGLNSVSFQADIVDYEGCCSDVTWTSDKDGVIGHGPNMEFTFPTAGTRTITVTATDNGANGGNNAATASDSLEITAGTSPPIVSIVNPTAGQNLYVGVTNVFSGTSLDPNEPFFQIPCASLVWTSNKPGDPFPVTGCNPQITFATTGARTLTLTGTDSFNLTAVATVAITVTTAPVTNPPAVTILNPLNDYNLDPTAVVTLTGKAQDPGNSALTYQWVLIDGPTQTVLGTGSAVSGGTITLPWKPSDNVSFHCGGELVTLRLDVTNASAKTGTASVTVRVAYPPC